MPSLLAYRQYIAKELGPFLASTVTSATANSLTDATWPIQSSLAQDDYWADAFLFRPNAALATDKVRLVASYSPSTGALVPDLAWTQTPTVGETYELHSVLEPLGAMTDLVNEALKRTMELVELTFTPAVNSFSDSLVTVAPWLEDPAWVRQVGWLAQTSDHVMLDPYSRPIRGMAVEDQGGVTLQHPGFFFKGTETIYVRCLKEGYDHCRPAGGTFGDQSGLHLDTDQAPCDLEWVGAAALIEAWRRFSQVLESAAKARLMPSREEAAARFTVLTHQQFSPWPLTFTPRGYGGPRHRSTGFLSSVGY